MIKTIAKTVLCLGLLTSAAWAGTSADATLLAESTPANEANGVALDQAIELRFAEAMDVATLNEQSISLLGPSGPTPITVVADRSGLIASVLARQELTPGSRYTLFVNAAKTATGVSAPLLTLAFTTRALGTATPGAHEVRVSAGNTQVIAALNSHCDNAKSVRGYRFCHAHGNVQDGIFTPGYYNTDGRWRTFKPLPKVLSAADFVAGELAPGTTVFGAVYRIDDQPLANVTVSIGERSARTDVKGRFVIENAPSSHQILLVDGSSANHGQEEYGQFPVAIDVQAGKPNAMPFSLFVPRISARDKVRIPSPTTADIVITHPAVPGLEIHIPAGAVVRDRNGKVLTEFAIVPMPVDRSPVPVPANFDQYFSMQPGGAHIDGLSAEAAKGLRTIYPNYSTAAKAKSVFYYYDAEHDGWSVYGEGQETADGTQVGVGENWGSQTFMPEGGGTVGGNGTHGGITSCQQQPPGPQPAEPSKDKGDPVNCSSGAFINRTADLQFNDLSPIAFTRTYVSSDTNIHSFGRGMTNPYDIYLNVPNQACVSAKSAIGNEIDFNDSNGAVYPFFLPVSQGATFFNNTAVHTKSPSRFFGATLSFTEHETSVALVDGTIYHFQSVCPSALTAVTDRFGNTVQIVGTAGMINEIIYPSGRSIAYTHDSYTGLIDKVTDSTGRSVNYAYDTSKHLTSATYSDGTSEQYTYDANGNMLTVKDRRGTTMVTNTYDTNGRVSQQTYADNTTYQFAYALSGNSVVTTTVTDTRGNAEQLTFNVDGYPTSITRGYGTAQAQTRTYQRFFGNFITSVTDPLGRVTNYNYDAFGHVTSQTVLYGTPNAATYTYTYTPDSHDLATVTDPLNHTTTYGYTNGCLTSVTDALNNTTSMTCNTAGQTLSVTDPLNNTTTFTYVGARLNTVTDPLNRTTTFATDDLGRIISTIDPLGRQRRESYDGNGRVATTTDALSQVTSYGYDNNGNLTSVTDPNGGKTSFSYDNRNHKLSRTDALNQTESWTYDGQSNVLTYTDRKNQTTTYQYDALNRPSLVTYADGSTVTPSYDAGNRLTQVVDSVSGTITRAYDNLDDLTQEATPQGTVNYTYDAIGRRSTMTPANQAQISYGYDSDNRLTGITQGSQSVGIAYDAANRRTSLTLPNGVVASYVYDNANELSSITYKTSSGTTLGSVGYTYDAGGQRITGTNSFGGDMLPTPSAGTDQFDLNNRQTLWNGFSLGYDVNGDPASNASTSPATTYTFDARHRLTQIQQGSTTIGSFQYDAFNRRIGKTVAGTTTSFLYDGANPVQETQGTTISGILTGMGIDERYARDDAAYGRAYFLTDALGSTVALTDSSQTVQQTYAYEPYGETTSTGSSNNPYQYTGRENDGTGLYYYRARYYSPTMKRFISEDPKGLSAGLNGYAYASGNPTSLIDPFGLSSVIFNNVEHTLNVVNGAGQSLGNFPAYNNTTNPATDPNSAGPYPLGIYPYTGYVPHGTDPNSSYGANGAFRFPHSGCPNCEVHSGRANRGGPTHLTQGCVRTNDDATNLMNLLNQIGDPLTGMTVTGQPMPTNTPPIDPALQGGPPVYAPDK